MVGGSDRGFNVQVNKDVGIIFAFEREWSAVNDGMGFVQNQVTRGH